ncbi:enoyl-CoA hydratase [Streptomyces viridiviolaceus]|uniref:Enoyl-CoA hydratase-related protein n=1 Tax=Streptomyces viridiviolaceus TaxID=68282 RepID=A0ABW2EF82_9ACTN|nr:enoyl-CoA hydratase-related protein [Streptomyces viridiviolaceus]GHB73742.1 enoyl-CoA hydratase [Streptomyces viridiviolaceus]
MSRSKTEATLEVRDGVAVLTLDAPERYNALTLPMCGEMVEAMEEVDRTPGIGALVVRGAGKAFCSGADLSTLSDAGKDPLDASAFADLGTLYETFMRLGRVTVPTLAAVRGPAVGAGMNLMLAADLRIVARDARLISGFLKRGLHPGGGHFTLLDRVAGRELTAAMALFGEEINGEQAVRAGLAWDAVDAEQLDDRALELARRVAKDPELARAAVANFRRETGATPMSWDVALQFERTTQMWSMRRG